MNECILLAQEKLPLLHSNVELPGERHGLFKQRTLNASPFFNGSSTAFRLFSACPPSHRHQTSKIRSMDLSKLAKVSKEGEGDSLLEVSVTRFLPPALSLKHGLIALKDALESFKLDPPSASSGLIRFEVSLPPSSKAFEQFFRLKESCDVFPQFYILKEVEIPSQTSFHLSEGQGTFAIGAAVDLWHSFNRESEHWDLFSRYLLADSSNITAYCFNGAKDNFELSVAEEVKGQFYSVIPQIELSDYEGFSLLAGTVAWHNDSHCSFTEALHSYEKTIDTACHHFSSAAVTCKSSCLNLMYWKLKEIEDDTNQVLYINSLSFSESRSLALPVSLEMKNGLSSHYFCIRLSETMKFAANMIEHEGERSFAPEACANVNALWASLIVEECFRLGLTYFCVAPGSRSSPLAVAASTHPFLTCIACFDERSLAYHAVGYARGSGMPAVVITTSGTAVSNLLPAVVEASQDFVPLLLLTADRPPELHDAGANQAINQVNHFGSYVRFFFNLPTPSDQVTARMVLTTIDSAVFHATKVPYGPVHVNCAFREPLDGSSSIWVPSCLDKLDTWISSSQPFTRYIELQPTVHCNGAHGLMGEVLQLMKSANHGLLLIGALNTEDDIWATLVLAKHLKWPVVADILSGIRLRKLWTLYPQLEENIIFIDHFDHVLLSAAVRKWAVADVILQVGSRITSKRISQMLEHCSPCSYILVDEHPYRHDPSHLVTHRIQSDISQFADCITGASFSSVKSKWSDFLQGLEEVVSWEIDFQICARNSLSEPYIFFAISDAISSSTALFIGNSMPIRDADMYSHGLDYCIGENIGLVLPYQYIKVAGNRGASGIDGLLSTASGFAAGCSKRVLCVIGDVSFLHDTNGLSFLRSRIRRKSVTIIVINNHGGSIFSFLPIVKHTESRVLNEFFYHTHAISVGNLCAAHGVKHVLVKTKDELQKALSATQLSDSDYVIEAESSIDSNAEFHSHLRECAQKTADQAFRILRRAEGRSLSKIVELKYSFYRIQLNAPPTSVKTDATLSNSYKEGFVISLSFNDGSVGYGEVAPFQLQGENLLFVEDQLRYITHLLKGVAIDDLLPVLRGSFSTWIWRSIGVPVNTILPCVRCGLEMAILNAIAAGYRSNFLSVLWPKANNATGVSEQSASIPICALIDNTGSPEEVANVACDLTEEGFCAIKLKVARRADPSEDALVVQEVRKKVGTHVTLRVDANRRWTYNQALDFAAHIKDYDVQYIEEPVQNEDDIWKFCEETGMPVALDETIDNIQGNILDALSRHSHSGIVALIIKPSFVGGFENAALLARWAHTHGKMAVVSAAFESSLSLSCYVQFARYLELQNAEICRVMGKEMAYPIAHGLGTYQWLKEDVTLGTLNIHQNPGNGTVEAYIDDADRMLSNFEINERVVNPNIDDEVCTYQLNMESKDFCYRVQVQEIGKNSNANVLVFLHGFLGTGTDWTPIMKALSKYAKCISMDLPGHGRSKVQCSPSHRLSVEVVAGLVSKLIDKLSLGEVTLVGYSMGARIALHMVLRSSAKIKGAIIISGSPGLRDHTARKHRAARDDSRASSLLCLGLTSFVENWYAGELWQSLRKHPRFKHLVTARLKHDDVSGLGKALSDLSIGRQMPLWEDLKQCKTPLLLIVGEKDQKFKKINQDMCDEISQGGSSVIYEMVEVPDSGHAVHVENPLALIRSMRQFLGKIRNQSQ